MIAACKADPLLDEYSLDFYSYRSKLIYLPMITKLSSFQDLARGLQTEIETFHANREQVILVAHSLGGLIARQYVLNCLKEGKKCPVSKLMLFAVPHTGAALANIPTALGLYHPQISSLCSNSDFLDLQNEDWIRLKVEECVSMHYLVGGADRIVTRDSAFPFMRGSPLSTLVGSNHRSIVEPRDSDDIRYKVVQKFVLGEATVLSTLAPDLALCDAVKPSDPLFDLYTAADKPFYVKLQRDEALEMSLNRGHVWVAGQSGVGKTTALRHLALSSRWQLAQIMLGAYSGCSAPELLRSLCLELADRLNSELLIEQTASTAEIIMLLKKLLRVAVEKSDLIVLIEEIPLAPGVELTLFLNLILQVILTIESDDNLVGRVQLAFSALIDPCEKIDAASKLREKIQFLSFTFWKTREIECLIDMLAQQLKPNLSRTDRDQILRRANGSPRFVKMVFRRFRNGTAENQTLSHLLDSVSGEQVIHE